MSRVMKEVGRGFKKITREIRNFFREPIVRAAVVAVMAYFTVGAALGAMAPATGAVSGAGSGAAAGTASGAVSSAAVTGAQLSPMWIGAAAETSTSALLTSINTMAAAGQATIAGGLPGAIAAGQSAAAAGAAAGATSAATTIGSSVWDKIANFGGDLAGNTKDWWGALSASEKLNMAKMGVDVAGAVFGPDPEEIYNAKYEAENKWRGAGLSDLPEGARMTPAEMNAARSNLGTPPSEQLFADPATKAQAPSAAPSAAQGQTPGPAQTQAPVPGPAPVGPRSTNSPQNPQDLFANTAPGQQDDKQQQSMLFGEGQMKQNIPVPSSLTGIAPTPGVRYI